MISRRRWDWNWVNEEILVLGNVRNCSCVLLSGAWANSHDRSLLPFTASRLKFIKTKLEKWFSNEASDKKKSERGMKWNQPTNGNSVRTRHHWRHSTRRRGGERSWLEWQKKEIEECFKGISNFRPLRDVPSGHHTFQYVLCPATKHSFWGSFFDVPVVLPARTIFTLLMFMSATLVQQLIRQR